MVALLFGTIECLRRDSHLRLTRLTIRPGGILNNGVVKGLTHFEGGRAGSKIFVHNVDTSRNGMHADSRRNADAETRGMGRRLHGQGDPMLTNMRP